MPTEMLKPIPAYGVSEAALFNAIDAGLEFTLASGETFAKVTNVADASVISGDAVIAVLEALMSNEGPSAKAVFDQRWDAATGN